jgi:hypothetical protein
MMTKLQTMLCLALVSAAPVMAAERAPEAPVTLSFRVASDGSEGVLLEGQSTVEAHGHAFAEHHAAKNVEEQKLEVQVSPAEGGQVLVRAMWHERSAQGEEVSWSPAFVMARGATAHLHLAFPAGGRELTISLGATLPQRAQVEPGVRLVPAMKEGRAEGLKALDVRPGSFWARAGVQSGDVLTRVNGVDLTGPDGELSVAMAPEGRLDLELERRGERLHTSTQVP